MNDSFNTMEKADKCYTSDLFLTDKDLDEMQKVLNYKIAFKLFGIFWVTELIASLAMFAVGAVLESKALMIAGGILFTLTLLFYVIYAALTSAKGVMNPKVAKGYSKNHVIPVWAGLCVLNIIISINSINWYLAFLWIVLTVMNCLISIFAKHNQKVVEKQLKEESED